jgi:acylphosphatase
VAAKQIFISGKVQGVGFRFHAYEKAKELNLKGWVKNLPDGRVELVVGGESAAIDAMVKWAQKGPSAAEVRAMDVLEYKDALPKEPFFIRREAGGN